MMHKLQPLHPPQPVGRFGFALICPWFPYPEQLGTRGSRVHALETWQAEDPKILPSGEM